jgi:hypothetical protein
MAILLIHLRRILLMCCILYLSCDLLSQLARNVKSQNCHLVAKKGYKLQFWTYIYTIYAYSVVIVNGLRWDHLNIFDFAISTSWSCKTHFSLELFIIKRIIITVRKSVYVCPKSKAFLMRKKKKKNNNILQNRRKS